MNIHCMDWQQHQHSVEMADGQAPLAIWDTAKEEQGFILGGGWGGLTVAAHSSSSPSAWQHVDVEIIVSNFM